MSKDLDEKVDAIRTVGVAGAGQMGGGIAQVAASSGLEVRMADASKDLAQAGKDKIQRLDDKLPQQTSRRCAENAVSRLRLTARTSIRLVKLTSAIKRSSEAPPSKMSRTPRIFPTMESLNEVTVAHKPMLESEYSLTVKLSSWDSVLSTSRSSDPVNRSLPSRTYPYTTWYLFYRNHRCLGMSRANAAATEGSPDPLTRTITTARACDGRLRSTA